VATRRRLRNQAGHDVQALQLHVKTMLGDYGGYSGSPVMLRSPSGVVIGVLVEQLPWRLADPLGQLTPATNVLYAIPIQDVVDRFGITAASVARPYRFNLVALPDEVIDRTPLLDGLLELVIGRSATPAGVVLVRGMPGMGKTVLALQLVHHARIWQTFYGGVLWVTAGQEREVDAAAILERLKQAVGVGERVDWPAEPTLVVVDDVWTDRLL